MSPERGRHKRLLKVSFVDFWKCFGRVADSGAACASHPSALVVAVADGTPKRSCGTARPGR